MSDKTRVATYHEDGCVMCSVRKYLEQADQETAAGFMMGTLYDMWDTHPVIFQAVVRFAVEHRQDFEALGNVPEHESGGVH